MKENNNDDLVKKLKQFTFDYVSGYMFDPDGEQLKKDLNTPVGVILDEFDRIASNAEYISKEDYLKFTSRMNQYFGRIMDRINQISPKIEKASSRITDEIVDDIIDGNF